MGKQHLEKSSVPQYAASKPIEYSFIDKDVAKLHGYGDELNPNVLVSLRYVQHDVQCFSEWSRAEMKTFWSFQEKLCSTTWKNVHKSSGKKEKSGFGYTSIELSKYPTCSIKKQLSKDINIIELRVTKKIRVHGFRSKSIYFVCWLDRNHNIIAS